MAQLYQPGRFYALVSRVPTLVIFLGGPKCAYRDGAIPTVDGAH